MLEAQPFHGAKLILLEGSRLLTYLRDDFDHIPFPAYWDLPGGGREGDETPVKCVLRELREKFGLAIPHHRLVGREYPSVANPGFMAWIFHGELTQAEIATIRFGDEGQDWRMMPIAEFLDHPRAVPYFKDWIRTIMASHRDAR